MGNYEFLRSWLGYCVTGRIDEEKFLIHIGSGSNFKSKLDSWMRMVLGEGMHRTCCITSLSHKGANNAELYYARSARYLSVQEPKEGSKIDGPGIKSATSTDSISVQAKYKAPLSYLKRFKINISTNFDPELPQGDSGVCRRTLRLHYRKVFIDRQDKNDMEEFWTQEKEDAGLIGVKDLHLERKLERLKQPFLTWLVNAAKDYYRIGLRLTPEMVEDTNQYRKKQQVLKNWMTENYEVCEDNIDNRLTLKSVYVKSLDFSGMQKGELSTIKFRAQLLQRCGFRVAKGRYTYCGELRGSQLCILGIKHRDEVQNGDHADQPPSPCDTTYVPPMTV